MLTIVDLRQEEGLSPSRMTTIAGGVSSDLTIAAAGTIPPLSDDVAPIDGQPSALSLACCNGKHFKIGKITLSTGGQGKS